MQASPAPKIVPPPWKSYPPSPHVAFLVANRQYGQKRRGSLVSIAFYISSLLLLRRRRCDMMICDDVEDEESFIRGVVFVALDTTQ